MNLRWYAWKFKKKNLDHHGSFHFFSIWTLFLVKKAFPIYENIAKERVEIWKKYDNNARYTFCYPWQVSLKNFLWKTLLSIPLRSTLEWGFFYNPAYDCMSIRFTAPLFFEVTTSAWTFLLQNDVVSSRYLDWM